MMRLPNVFRVNRFKREAEQACNELAAVKEKLGNAAVITVIEANAAAEKARVETIALIEKTRAETTVLIEKARSDATALAEKARAEAAALTEKTKAQEEALGSLAGEIEARKAQIIQPDDTILI
jgi:cell division septum initiation protein DivIVA